MKPKIVILILLVSGIAQAEYIDEKGVKRMGRAPEGVVQRKESSDYKAIGEGSPNYNTKPVETKIATVEKFFSGPTKRIIDGRKIDFSPIMEWANERLYLINNSPSYGSGGGSYLERIGGRIGNSGPSEAQINTYNERLKKNEEEGVVWKDYLILQSEVISVVNSSGLLIKPSGSKEPIAIVNHPNQSSAVDGNILKPFLAKPISRVSYTTALGSHATVAAYDYGTPVEE